MTTWKYTDDTKRTVIRGNADGSQESCLVAAIADWMAGGNTPAPADVPTLAQLQASALAEVRALRAAFFSALAGLQSEATARGNAADALAIATLQQGARDITQTNLSGCTSKAQIDAAFLAAWIALVSAASLSVKLAFAELKK